MVRTLLINKATRSQEYHWGGGTHSVPFEEEGKHCASLSVHQGKIGKEKQKPGRAEPHCLLQ